MMGKIPVGATIAHAYRFAVSNIVQILAVSWLPWALIMAGLFLVRDSLAMMQLASATKNFALMHGRWAPVFLFYLAAIILVTMQMVGLFQLALDRPIPSRWFYFSLGKPLWRLIGGVLLAALCLIAAALAYVIVCFVLGFLLRGAVSGSPSGTLIMGLAAAVAFVVGYCAFICATLRFFFLLAPVVIAEDRISVFRAWTLTRGNFWRIFLIVLALLLPIIVVELGGMFALAGPMPFQPGDPAAQRLAQVQWQMALNSRMATLWYITYPVMILLSVVFYAASSAAQAFAYRSVAESTPVTGNTLPD
jgi:hypothetical protein